MAYIVRMPDLGLGRDPGTLRAWFVDPGDRVKADDVLAEVASGNAVAELGAREAGVIREVYFEESATVPPGSPLAIVAGPDEDISGLEADLDRATIDTRKQGHGATAVPTRHAVAVNEDDMTGTVSAGALAWRYSGGSAGDEPSPVTLFLSGLASCLSLSIRYQADMRDVKVNEIEVTADASPTTGSVEKIELAVTVDAPDADDATLARMVEYGEQSCHVAELLREDLPIDLNWQRAN